MRLRVDGKERTNFTYKPRNERRSFKMEQVSSLGLVTPPAMGAVGWLRLLRLPGPRCRERPPGERPKLLSSVPISGRLGQPFRTIRPIRLLRDPLEQNPHPANNDAEMFVAYAPGNQDKPGVRAFLLVPAVGYPAKVCDVEGDEHAVLGCRQFQQLVVRGAFQLDLLAIHGTYIVAVVF